MEDTAKSVIYVRLPAALVLGQSWKACHQIIQDPKITYVLRLPYSNITYRVFIKYYVFSLGQSPEYCKIFGKNTIFNEHPV